MLESSAEAGTVILFIPTSFTSMLYSLMAPPSTMTIVLLCCRFRLAS